MLAFINRVEQEFKIENVFFFNKVQVNAIVKLFSKLMIIKC